MLPDGELGELVFTSLTKQALPIIRYRTRDLTRLLPGTARPAFRRMEKVTGRSDDMIILRGVNVFPTQLEEIVLRTAGLAPHFQLILERDGTARHADRARRGAPRLPAGAPRSRRAARSRARSRIGSGSPSWSRSSTRDTLERSAGKLQRVIDRRS